MASEVNDPVPVVRCRRRWRALFVIVGLGIAIAAVAVGRQMIHAARVRSELRQFIAEFDRDEPGWQIQAIEAARATVPDDENSVPLILRARRAIPRLRNED